ncbi:MAG: zinc-finger domain-containing protein [Pseudomonadota bacterium]
MMAKKTEIQASTKKVYQVTKADLPLCCPMPNMRLWDSHPRIYLPIHETGREICPYCGSEYVLKDFKETDKN